MKLRLDSEIKEIDNLLVYANTIKDEEAVSHFVKYICVRASGLIESVVRQLFDEFHSGTCKSETATFITKKIDRTTNLDDDNIQQLLASFNSKWKDDYLSSRTDKHKSSINTIVHNRNNIAHGRSKSVTSLTYSRMNEYYSDLKDVIAILKKIVRK